LEYIFSKHSIGQIKLRGLSMDIIEDVLLFPGRIIGDVADIVIYQKIVIEDNKRYLYRVFVNKAKKPPLVVTAYKTSKTDKYDNQI
jgi:hypothetical protein